MENKSKKSDSMKGMRRRFEVAFFVLQHAELQNRLADTVSCWFVLMPDDGWGGGYRAEGLQGSQSDTGPNLNPFPCKRALMNGP